MKVRTLKLIAIFGATFFVALFSGGLSQSAEPPLFEVPLSVRSIRGTVQKGTLEYETRRGDLSNVVKVLFVWRSPVVFEPGVVTVQCLASDKLAGVTTFAAYSWMIPAGSIDGHFGMLSLHLGSSSTVAIVECHWQFEAPSIPAVSAPMFKRSTLF